MIFSSMYLTLFRLELLGPSVLIDNVKQSHYWPGQGLRVPGGWGSKILRQSAHEGGKVVSPTHRPPLPPQDIFLVLIYVRGWVSTRAMVQSEALCQWIIPMTQSGIEPATFRIVVQYLKQLRPFNPLALELDIYSLAHHLCKMWIFYKPRSVTLGNSRHFVEE